MGPIRLVGRLAVFASVLTSVTVMTLPASAVAQTAPLRVGEAFVTRFSGSKAASDGSMRIDPDGPVGVILGLGAPNEPPLGQHWLAKPIRAVVRAADVGQVFGVTLDDQTPPNVYLTATAAFGLHRTQAGWMPGMWGPGGGPGTVWRLDAANGYRASVFAQIGAHGRTNSAAALGNIAFDRLNRQFFVSDLESGLITRLGRDGRQLAAFDHGVEGRPAFFDAETKQRASLPQIAGDPSLVARPDACEGGFDQTPACWNVAPSGRRIWGLGVRRDPMGAGGRLYYAVWSSPAFADATWTTLSDEDKRSSVWSVRLAPGGDFDRSDVRREFILPDFFSAPQDVERAGFSQPVSDIAFAECGPRPVMLAAERGGMRNLGLGAENAFATPGEARLLRYELDREGAWRPVGRYDVGNVDSSVAGGAPMKANCAGGAAFGPDIRNPLAPAQRSAGPDSYVWATGDNLCSPQAPCRLPLAAPQQASVSSAGAFEADPAQVHGVQGGRADVIEELAPQLAPAGAVRQATSPLDDVYLVDVDPVINANGAIDEAQLIRNDATQIGDIAIYQACLPARPPSRVVRPGVVVEDPLYLLPPPPPGFIVPGHAPDLSHARWASHGARTSHYRIGSHNPAYSHQRWRSHQPYWSHGRTQSHSATFSHSRFGSHNRWASTGHDDRRSHATYRSHTTVHSHNPRISAGHAPAVSTGHDRRQSWHASTLSQGHSSLRSQGHSATVSQGHSMSLSRIHRTDQSRTHSATQSRGHSTTQSQGHSTTMSQAHSTLRSQGHHTALSTRPLHDQALSSRTTHRREISVGLNHNPKISSPSTHATAASNTYHSTQLSRPRPAHNASLSRGTTHTPAISRSVAPPPMGPPPGARSPLAQPPSGYRPPMAQPPKAQPSRTPGALPPGVRPPSAQSSRPQPGKPPAKTRSPTEQPR